MKRIHAVLSLLLVALVTGAWVVKETKLNEDFIISVNAGGMQTPAIVIDGATAVPTFPNGALGLGAPTTLVTNGDAEALGVPSGWATYDEGTSAAPVDGTGDHVDANAITAIARETGSGDIISGSASWKLVAGASAQGEGWAYSFTIPANSYLKNALNEISFGYYMSTAATSDLFRVYVYDVTNAALITPSFTSCGGGSTPSLTSTTTPCAAKLSWVATTGTSYRLLFHAASNTAATLYIDDLFVGQRGVQVGPGQSEWASYTPLLTEGGTGNPVSLNTSTNYSAVSGRWKRNGDTMQIQVSFRNGNGGTATGGTDDLAISLPSGYTIDTSKLVSGAGGYRSIGTTYINGTATHSVTSFSATTFGSVGLEITEIVASVGIGVFAEVPIAEWAGGVAYGENKIVYISDDGTNDVEGPSGSLVPNVGFGTGVTDRTMDMSRFNVQATDDCELQLNYRGTNWTSAAGLWSFSSGNNSATLNNYGTQGTWTGATTYLARFGNQGLEVSASNVSNGTRPWSDEYTAGTRYRVKCVRGGVATAFGLASATEPGLLKHYEEGTFTPAAAFTGGNGTLSHSVQTGKYTRIGNVVYFTISLSFSKGTASNNMTVAGLPYTSAAGFPGYVLVGDYAGMQNSGWPVTGQVSASGTSIVMYKNNGTGGATNVTAAEIGASTTVEMSGWYFL